jgi:undecaprenyl pyrophosphate phosphatase UppP
MNTLQAIIIAIIEGLTEYLPISSTAHMIFTSSYFGIQEDDFVKLFQVSIQFGAILAVVVLYWKKFLAFPTLKVGMNFYTKLAFAVIPALILGKLFDGLIDILKDIGKGIVEVVTYVAKKALNVAGTAVVIVASPIILVVAALDALFG